MSKKIEDKSIKDFIIDLKHRVIDDEKNSEEYRRKMAIAHEQRLALRNNDNEPWEGAPNVSMPFTDKLIKKQVPAYVLSIYNSNKLASVKVKEHVSDPQNILQKKAKLAEKYLNYSLKQDKSLLVKLTLAANYINEKGKVYFLIYKKFFSEYQKYEISIDSIMKDLDAKRNQALLLDPKKADQIKQEIPTGEEYIKSLKLLSNEELINELSKNIQYGFDIEDEEHLKIMKEVVEKFKSGDEIIEYSLENVYYKPEIDIIPPEDIILPYKSPLDLQKNWRIARSYWLNEDELIAYADNDIFNKKVVSDYIKSNKDTSTYKEPIIYQNQSTISGVYGDRVDGMYYLRDVYCYYKDEKGELAKYILTYIIDDDSSNYLRFEKLDVIDDKFPLICHDKEYIIDSAYASRGIPEMVRYVQETIDEQENNRMIRDIVQNTPMFTIRKSAGITGEEIRFVPGQGIVVDNPSDITFFNPIKGADIASERIEAQQKSYGEELVGSVDFSFGKAGSPGSGSGAKTLGELNLVQGEAQKIASLDLLLWFNSWSQALQMYYDILKTTLDGSITIGGELITREDLNFPVDVRSNGSIEDSDRMFKANKQLARYQLVASSSQDLVSPEDRYNALYDYMENDNVENPERYITNPIEIMKDASVQAANQLQQGQQQLALINQELIKKEEELAKVEEKTRRTTIKQKVKSSENNIKKDITITREV